MLPGFACNAGTLLSLPPKRRSDEDEQTAVEASSFSSFIFAVGEAAPFHTSPDFAIHARWKQANSCEIFLVHLDAFVG